MGGKNLDNKKVKNIIMLLIVILILVLIFLAVIIILGNSQNESPAQNTDVVEQPIARF